MDKPAPTNHDVHALIRRRWSPRAFSEQPVDEQALLSVLEAARWAPSCFNEQPWHFLVARREDEQAFSTLLSCLVEVNQAWAQHAAVLMVSVARTTFAKNGKPNRHAWHDVGLAAAQLTLQATHLGLAVHQMGGFSPERVRELCAVPDGFDPVAAIALGHPGQPDALPEPLRERERAPRERRPLDEMVFSGSWDRAMDLARER